MSTRIWPEATSNAILGLARAQLSKTVTHCGTRVEFNRKFQDTQYIAPRSSAGLPEAVCPTCGEEPFACRCAYAGGDCGICGRSVAVCKCGQGE